MTLFERLLPWIALIVTVFIWAAYLVAVRAAVNVNLNPIDVGLLRTVPASLVFIPFLFRRGLFPEGSNITDAILIGLIGGGAFLVFLTQGLKFAPTADAGVFTPAMLPVCAATLSMLFIGQRFYGSQLLGLLLIVGGAAAIGGTSLVANASSGAWRGHILFLAASMSWAIYTLRFRQSGLRPFTGVAILVVWPAMFFIAAAILQGTTLHTLPLPIFVFQLTLGFSAGLIANFTFFYAIQKLGPVIPSASAACVPILVGFGAWITLGEVLSWYQLAGMGIAAIGVLLASGILTRSQSIR